MKKLILVLAGIAAISLSYSQSKQEMAKRWADSVMQTLNNDQRIDDHSCPQ
jgi:hypothetical protein